MRFADFALSLVVFYNDFIDAGSSNEAPFVTTTKDQWKMFWKNPCSSVSVRVIQGGVTFQKALDVHSRKIPLTRPHHTIEQGIENVLQYMQAFSQKAKMLHSLKESFPTDGSGDTVSNKYLKYHAVNFWRCLSAASKSICRIDSISLVQNEIHYGGSLNPSCWKSG